MVEVSNLTFFQELADKATYEIFVTDAVGDVIYVNEITNILYGMTPKEMIGKNISELEEKLFFPSATLQVIETGKSVELMQKTRRGKRLFVQSIPVFSSEGKLSKVISYTRE